MENKKREYQWIRKLVLWGGKNPNKPLSRLTKKEIRFTLLKSGMRGRYYNQPWSNKRDNKRILWTIVCQPISWSRWSGQIPQNTQPTRTESWRNGKLDPIKSK